MDREVNKDLWLVMLGAALGGNSREEVLGMVDAGDAPPDLALLLQACRDKDRGPVAKWLDERRVEWGGGMTAIQAIARKVTKDADEAWWQKQCMRMRGLSSRSPSEIVQFLELVLAEMRERTGQ